MNNLLHNGQEAFQEALKIARFQGIDGPEFCDKIEKLAKHFDTYAEFVLSEHGFEVVTIGNIVEMAETARLCGASPRIVETFVKCAEAFPGKKLAIKLYFDPSSTGLLSLYVRTMAPSQDGLNFLTSVPYLADLAPVIGEFVSRHRTMYILGLKGKGDDIWLKTYHIGDVYEGRKLMTGQKGNGHPKKDQSAKKEDLGFVSYELRRGQPVQVKYHMTNVGWDQVVFPTPRWQQVADFALNQMGYREMSYFGIFEQPNRQSQLKFYVERIGAIPTEYDAR